MTNVSELAMEINIRINRYAVVALLIFFFKEIKGYCLFLVLVKAYLKKYI